MTYRVLHLATQGCSNAAMCAEVIIAVESARTEETITDAQAIELIERLAAHAVRCAKRV